MVQLPGLFSVLGSQIPLPYPRIQSYYPIKSDNVNANKSIIVNLLTTKTLLPPSYQLPILFIIYTFQTTLKFKNQHFINHFSIFPSSNNGGSGSGAR